MEVRTHTPLTDRTDFATLSYSASFPFPPIYEIKREAGREGGRMGDRRRGRRS